MDLEFTFHVLTVGFQLGYQFVFWNRVTLDMILFGPGISWYKFKADLSTNLDPDEESELFQKINDALEEKIPGYSLVIEPGSFEKNGSVNTTTLGYRYVVMVGIRF
jgi:diaminopimelate decarboxylase